MAQKCVHQGCGKLYTDESEPCNYHPGPPVFHEGQKGWKCCKPRVLTFEEFMALPPCTEGHHSTTDVPPQIEKKTGPADAVQVAAPEATPALPRAPIASPAPADAAAAAAAPAPAVPEPESEDDNPALEIPDGKICRRRTCGVSYKKGQPRGGDADRCVHHPGVPVFHEGSKGYSCCKRRVLEFDQFMKIEGCQSKDHHLFVGSGEKDKKRNQSGGEELLDTVRTDFYQTPTSVIASFFLKKINKDAAKVEFQPQSIALDLPTADATRYRAEVSLFAAIDAEKSSHKILGTKLEVTLVKAEVASWPVLRADDPRRTGEILQVGRAGKA